MEGMGKEKLYFPLLKFVKHQKPLSGFPFPFSTNFVAHCSSKRHYPVALFFIIFTETTASPMAAKALLINASSM